MAAGTASSYLLIAVAAGTSLAIRRLAETYAAKR